MAMISHQANKLVKVIAEILNFLLVVYHVFNGEFGGEESTAQENADVTKLMQVSDQNERDSIKVTLKKQKAEDKIKLLESNKEDAVTRANKLEADMDSTIRDYQIKITNNLTCKYLDKVDDIKNKKDDVGDK